MLQKLLGHQSYKITEVPGSHKLRDNTSYGVTKVTR